MFEDYDVIHRYMRAQALADGTLLDAGDLAKEVGFRIPVALTSEVWNRYVEVPKGVVGQDMTGRLWDVLWMLNHAIRQGEKGPQLLFKLFVRNDNTEPSLVTLKAVCGPDDDGSPCITVMLPDQD